MAKNYQRGDITTLKEVYDAYNELNTRINIIKNNANIYIDNVDTLQLIQSAIDQIQTKLLKFKNYYEKTNKIFSDKNDMTKGINVGFISFNRNIT